MVEPRAPNYEGTNARLEPSSAWRQEATLVSKDGSLTAEEISPTRAWDATNGHTTERRFRGVRDVLESLANDLIAKGGVLRIHFTEEALPFWCLSATYQGMLKDFPGLLTPDENQIVTTWGRAKNFLQKDIWGAPKINAIFDSHYRQGDGEINTSDRIKAFVRWKMAIENFLAGGEPEQGVDDSTVEQIVQYTFDAFPPTTKEMVTLVDFVGALAKGVQSYNLCAFVLRKMMFVPIGLNVPMSTESFVNRVFSSTQSLRELENVPDLAFLLPDGIWLKQSADIEPGNGLHTVTQEFWHADDFATALYEVASLDLEIP